MLSNLAETNTNLDTERKERKQDVADATKRKDDMQANIDKLYKYNKDKEERDYKLGQEDLHSDRYLRTNKDFV